MNDETLDEIAGDDAEVARLLRVSEADLYGGEVYAERAAAKGLPGLLEWMMTGRVL